MKKAYQTPVIDIEKFDVIDVITESAAAAPGVVTGANADATDSTYAAAAEIEW